MSKIAKGVMRLEHPEKFESADTKSERAGTNYIGVGPILRITEHGLRALSAEQFSEMLRNNYETGRRDGRGETFEAVDDMLEKAEARIEDSVKGWELRLDNLDMLICPIKDLLRVYAREIKEAVRARFSPETTFTSSSTSGHPISVSLREAPKPLTSARERR